MPLGGAMDITNLDPAVVPFVACGDISLFAPADSDMIMDADKSYPIDEAFDNTSVQPPIAPPYAQAKEKTKKSAAS